MKMLVRDLVPDIYDVGQVKKMKCFLFIQMDYQIRWQQQKLKAFLKKENISTLDKEKFLVEIALENKQEKGKKNDK